MVEEIIEMIDRLRRHRRLKYEEMSCFARFKFDKSQPSFRVHVWDIFDEVLLEAKSFEVFFEIFFIKLSDMYLEQGFTPDLCELSH